MSERGGSVAVAAFFVLYLVAGIAIFPDYGVSWDETLNRDLGLATLRYVEARWSDDPIPWSQMSQGLVAEQGPFFETILVAVEKIFSVADERQVLLLRHLATFLTFWGGSIAFYVLLRQRFGDRRVALLGVGLLVATPRLFAHSFYNSKDAVLTAIFIVAALTMLRFLREKSPASALLHAIACAAAIGVRVVGVLLTAVTLALLLLELARPGASARVRRQAALAAGFHLVLLASFVVIFWPSIWENPLGGLIGTLGRLSAARQMDNAFSLYLGSFVPVDRLPWHYLPVWILVTLPVPFVLLLAAGFVAVARRLSKESWLAPGNTQNLAFALLAFVPVLTAIVVRPVLYDDWRHFYFIAPFLVAIALTAVTDLFEGPRARRRMLGAALVTALHGIGILIRYHPYQNVYFSPLAGRRVDERFELDYWGLSFREGLEHVLAIDPAETVKVEVSDFPGVMSSWMVEGRARSRLRFAHLDEATYFLSNHRQPEKYDDFRAGRYPCVHEVYAVRVAGATLLAVYKIR